MAAAFAADQVDYVNPEDAAKRLNPTISPQDQKWKSIHHKFTQLVNNSSTSIRNILSENFTRHEARMLDPSDRPDIKKLQNDNTERYNALLAGRFKGVDRGMASKLTMMYFGLPVEPIISPLDELAMMLGHDNPEPARYNVEPPLRFLSAHNARNWGKDSLRGKEAPNYPIPIPEEHEPRLGLRGGDTMPDADEMVDYAPDSETPALPQDEWVYLYGYNGCIPIVPRKWQSYSQALRQLLELAPSNDSDYEYTFTCFARSTRRPASITDTLPLTEGSPAMEFLRQHFADRSTHGHTDCCAFFVKYSAQQEPLHWEPQKEQFATDLVKIGRSVFAVDDGPISYAYLPFPKTKTMSFTIEKYASNQYNLQFKAAIEVLFGKPEEDLCHHALFRLTDRNNPNRDDIPAVYGAMSQPQWVWETLHPLNSPDSSWMVERLRLDEDAAAVILPDYSADPHPWVLSATLKVGISPFKDAFDAIQSMVTDAFDSSTLGKMDSMLVIPGDFAFGRTFSSDCSAYEIPAKSPFLPAQQARLADELDTATALDQSKNHFFVLHPKWSVRQSRMLPGWSPKRSAYVELPPLTSKIADLDLAIKKLCTLTQHVPTWNREQDFIYIKALPPFDSTEVPRTDSPVYVVHPDAKEDDWFAIRTLITACDVSVTLVKRSEVDWRMCIPKSNAWGVRANDWSRPLPKVAKQDRLEVNAIEDSEESRHASEVSSTKGPFMAANKALLKRDSAFDNPPKGLYKSSGSSTRHQPRVEEITDDEHMEAIAEETASVIHISSSEDADPLPDYMDLDASSEYDNSSLSSSTHSSASIHSLPPGPFTFRPLRPSSPIDKDSRARTWAHQPSIFEDWTPRAWPSCTVPITAAPEEKILRTTSNVPMVTKAILTPTEQAELQRSFWEVRNVALKRTMMCPFKGCEFSYRLDEMKEMESHVKRVHLGEKCMWCDEVLFEWWDDEQRMRHLRTKHKAELVRALGINKKKHRVRRNIGREFGGPFDDGFGGARPDLLSPTPMRSGPQPAAQFPITSNNPLLDSQPQVIFDLQRDPLAKPNRFTHRQPELLRPVLPAATTLQPPQATAAGSSQAVFEQSPTVQAPQPLGMDSEEFMRELRLISTEMKAAVTEGPHPLFPVTPFGRGRLPPHRLLVYPLEWYDSPGPVAYSDPCTTCPEIGCDAPDLEGLHPRGVWGHFERYHPENEMDHCPFCLLSFRFRVGKDERGRHVYEKYPVEECIRHLDCHVYRLWDKLEPPHPYLRHQIPFRQYQLEQQSGEQDATLPFRGTEEYQRAAQVTPPGSPLATTESQPGQKCPYFEKCGAFVGAMTDQQLRRHVRDSHGKEVQALSSDEEESPRPLTPLPPPLTGHAETQVEEDALQFEEDDVFEDEDGDEDDDIEMVEALPPKPTPEVPKRRARARPSTPGDDMSGEESAASARRKNIAAKRAAIKARLSAKSRRSAEDSSSDAPKRGQLSQANLDPLGEGDPENAVSESRSSVTHGRARPSKKARRGRAARDDDGEYEDAGAESDDEYDEIEEDQQGTLYRRRARSPDWVKKLGPGDPDFDPDDDMYCSKCLRKAPKRRGRSPIRSPIGREQELEYHTDPSRCCRIRNGIGSADRLPNRSGWIRYSDLPRTLGDLKARFLCKHPSYARTIYPTNPSDSYASLWRSDPNNEDNSSWWGIPWPPYEGHPPFPGDWTDPGMPEGDGDHGSRRTRVAWQGRPEHDPMYRYQSDSDSADDLKPDEDDIQELQEEASNDGRSSSILSGIKRRRTGEPVTTPEQEGAEDVPPADDAGPAKKVKKTSAGDGEKDY
ncbi:hypothetical protein ACJ41O_007131 [Fusarium nematophilum]